MLHHLLISPSSAARVALVWLGTLALTGCAALTLERPGQAASADLDFPEAWKSAGKGNSGAIATGWMRTFGDEQLDRLVDEALAYNRNLQAAAARLRSARFNMRAAGGRRIPSVDAGFSASRTRTGEGARRGGENGGNEEGGAARGAVSPGDLLSSNYGVSLLDASWEIDLWGRLKDLHHAAYADYLAAEADFRSARLSLAANVAKAWFDLIAAGLLVELAKETRDSFVRNYRIIERNYKAGDETASPLDVQFARNNVASAERALVSARLDLNEAARPLEVLLGRYPAGEISARDDLPNLPDKIPAGLPATLLWRRPDLLSSSAAVMASASRTDAARKDLLPSVSLTGRVSTSGDTLTSDLLNPEFFVWRAASSIAQTLYEGGTPTAEARRALAQNEVAIREFANDALQAFSEVESALDTARSLAEQENFLEVELKQANLAEEQAARDYAEGVVGILEILEAQRRAVNARTAMIQLRNRRLQNRVDLHLALGGDFETIPPAPPLDKR